MNLLSIYKLKDKFMYDSAFFVCYMIQKYIQPLIIFVFQGLSVMFNWYDC